MKVKSESEVAQSCPTLRYPMDCSPPGSSVHGISQATVPEWGAIAFSPMKYYTTIKMNKQKLYMKGCLALKDKVLSKRKNDDKVIYESIFIFYAVLG